MSNVTAPIRMMFVFGAVLTLSVVANAQFDDWHMFSRDLFVKSTFAHGYMHGYEEGFHAGDIDMQMGRHFREVKGQERFKKPSGYKGDFGPKGIYEDGYRKGYLVGYIDSYEGRDFRAVALIRQTADPSSDRSQIKVDHEFDAAFRSGYDAGQSKGLQDGRANGAEGSLAQISCQAPIPAKGGERESKADYCEAYRNGYGLGYSDGFANQREHGKVLASK